MVSASKVDVRILCNIIMEMVFCHLCCIQWVGNMSQVLPTLKVGRLHKVMRPGSWYHRAILESVCPSTSEVSIFTLIQRRKRKMSILSNLSKGT